MIVVTTNEIPGHRIDAVFGEVMGLTVRSRDIGAQFTASFRALGGGELPEMTKALYESRQEVMHRMVVEAESKGANAIVAMRFDTQTRNSRLSTRPTNKRCHIRLMLSISMRCVLDDEKLMPEKSFITPS